MSSSIRKKCSCIVDCKRNKCFMDSEKNYCSIHNCCISRLFPKNKTFGFGTLEGCIDVELQINNLLCEQIKIKILWACRSDSPVKKAPYKPHSSYMYGSQMWCAAGIWSISNLNNLVWVFVRSEYHRHHSTLCVENISGKYGNIELVYV